MLRKMLAGFMMAWALAPATGMAADVSGKLLYDGLPVTSVFPDITKVTFTAAPWNGGAQIVGTVDLATSSYSLSGLNAELYQISAYLDRVAPDTQVGNPGDLIVLSQVEPTDAGETLTHDVDVLFLYRTLTPVDANDMLNGSGQDCTAYPEAQFPITVTLEPVPRATSYIFTAHLYGCPPQYLASLTVTNTAPTAQLEWGTAGEDYQNIYVTCTGASGRPLCSGPVYMYNDSSVWALLLREGSGSTSSRGVHHANALFVPAVASVDGVDPTFWTSAVSIASRSASSQTLRITYTPRDTDGSATFTTMEVALPANSVVSWTDIVSELFAASGAGSLEIRGSNIVVTSRTSTPSAGAGTYGQGVPPIQPEDLLSTGGTATAVMAGVDEGSSFRTNLGLCEVWGESVTVNVTVRDGAGTELGSKSYQLRPYEYTQIDRVAVKVAGTSSLSGGTVEVTVTSGGGRIGAYLSVIDQATGDPTYIAVKPQSPIGS